MAFKMKGSPAKMGTIQGTAGHSSALKMKMEKDAAAKMKKEAAMKMKEEAAMKMKMESAAKMKKESAMKAAKPDFPDIDGDGNTTESMKQAAADKKSGVKMKKPSPNKVLRDGSNLTKKSEDNIKKSTKSDPYAKALKKDPKLASYIKDRKKHKPGSAEYEALQAKINKAYGKTRSSKLKAAQIKNQAKKDAATTKPDVKAIDKGQKITAKADVKKAELTENVTRKLAKNEMKSAKRMKGKDSKEYLQARKEFLQAKEDDRQGKEGGKRQTFFRKLSSKINKRKQEKIDKKLAEKK
jgi:hypothetical protein